MSGYGGWHSFRRCHIRVALFNAGAADVLAAPADRLRLSLCRSRRCQGERVGKPLHLREFLVLGVLARHRDHSFEQCALLRAAWQRRFDPDTNLDHGFA
jgi:hypothetical protein